MSGIATEQAEHTPSNNKQHNNNKNNIIVLLFAKGGVSWGGRHE